jgi:hypothetical protein
VHVRVTDLEPAPERLEERSDEMWASARRACAQDAAGDRRGAPLLCEVAKRAQDLDPVVVLIEGEVLTIARFWPKRGRLAR